MAHKKGTFECPTKGKESLGNMGVHSDKLFMSNLGNGSWTIARKLKDRMYCLTVALMPTVEKWPVQLRPIRRLRFLNWLMQGKV